ncbi:Hca operon transcriptional activator [Clostridiales bacterium CHKCI001]|nr:Hca operon transcriptional activator [Clostridiales bacterium CHKCI001]
MELRTLKYFLTVAKEENITSAAEILHMTQPTLSRQIMDLEKELGKPLFTRTNRKTILTEDGLHLRKRAEEIISLVERTTSEFQSTDETIYGEIHIGAGETDAMRLIANTIKRIQQQHPMIKYRLYSGHTDDVVERLEHGLLDFGLLFEPVNKEKYNYIPVPVSDTLGILMRKDSPFAVLDAITRNELTQMPLLSSARLSFLQSILSEWLGTDLERLNLVASYNLIYNASLMVETGIGNAICIDKLINTTGESNLCFRPLKPHVSLKMVLVWKKHPFFSKACELFLSEVQKEFHNILLPYSN